VEIFTFVGAATNNFTILVLNFDDDGIVEANGGELVRVNANVARMKVFDPRAFDDLNDL